MSQPRTTPKTRFLLLGAGQLAETLYRRLERSMEVIWRPDGSSKEVVAIPCSVVISASDCPLPDFIRDIAASCFSLRKVYLPVWLEFGEGRLGPLNVPPKSGCVVCAETRRLRANMQKDYYSQALRKASALGLNNPWKLPAVLDLLVSLAVHEVQTFQQAESSLCDQIVLLNLWNLSITRHRFQPDPLCAVCGEVPDDTADLAAMQLVPGKYLPPNSWRLGDLMDKGADLQKQFVDARTGIATALGVDITTPLCATGSARFPFDTIQKEDWGAGLTLKSDQSKAVAVVEVLERYAGLRPRGKRTSVFTTYASIESSALDPRLCTLYSREQYADPRFPCVPFREDIPCSWVWGFSFRKQTPILVLEQLVYYDMSLYPRDASFVIESSSGCATGSCLEEALWYGLLEVIERDAILRTWYGRLSPARVDVASVRSPTARMVIDRIEAVTGYKVIVLDVSQEFRVPALWVVAVNSATDQHKALSASKAHVDPETALLGALGEITGTLLYHRQQSGNKREKLLKMAANSDLITELLDHSLVAGLPETFKRMDFLFNNDPARSIDEVFPLTDRPEPRDISALAQMTISQVLAHGFDVIAVNQTAPEQVPFDLHTVRVIVPGLLPMSYCAILRRIADSPRLRDTAEINPFPHPFA